MNNRFVPIAITAGVVAALIIAGTALSITAGRAKRSGRIALVPGLIKPHTYELRGGFVNVHGREPGILMPPYVLDGNRAKLRAVAVIKLDINKDIAGTTGSSFSQADQLVSYDGSWLPPGLSPISLHYEAYVDAANRTTEREKCIVDGMSLDLSGESGNNAAIVTVKTDKNGNPISKSVTVFHVPFQDLSASEMEGSPDVVYAHIVKYLKNSSPKFRELWPSR